MKVVLSFPSAYGNPVEDFDNNGEEITYKNFVKTLKDDFKKRNNAINTMMVHRFRRNMSINDYEKDKNEYEKIEYTYNDIDSFILNVDKRQETIDNLIEYFKTEEQFAIIIRFINLNDHPDIDTDVREWYTATKKIVSSDRLSDEEKMANLPTKDMKVSFIDSKSNAILRNCKILTKNKTNEYVIIVEKIVFVVNR